jgi:hypothetical protein
MSRSRRHTPICGRTNAASDHPWKKKAARKLRCYVRQALHHDPDGDTLIGKRWEVENPWSSLKDGKSWLGKRHPRLMRK